MTRALQLEGQKFERLLVIESAGKHKSRRGRFWFCQCDCGKAAVVSATSLNTGRTRSCGCLTRETPAMAFSLPKGEAAFNSVVKGYKEAAEKKKFPFTINKEVFRRLTKGNCFYCGSLPSTIMPSLGARQKVFNGSYVYNGIDRIDNSKGYTENNVVSCCGKCNFMKRDMSLDEFKKHLLLIVNHWVLKGG